MSIDTSLTLDLALSDERAKVYPADLFDVLVAAKAAAPPARLRLKRLSNEVMELRHDAPRLSDPNYCGMFDHGSGDTANVGWLCRQPGVVITQRLPERDRDVLAGVEHGPGWARSRLSSDYSVAKSALVLAVALLVEEVPDELWNFAELRTDGPFYCSGHVRASLGRRIKQFLVIVVHVDDTYWGQFTFAALPPSNPPT